jgi:peptide/nickel transport system ATP-binding protein
MNSSEPLLSVEDLSVQFSTHAGEIPAVQNINLSLERGKVLGLIGESGSGKSVTLRSILRLLPKKRTSISGRILVDGDDALALKPSALSSFRGGLVSMIFQEPATSLDPVFTIGHQIAESVMRHTGVTKKAAIKRALEMLELVKIPSAKSRLSNYPHEMSGGMRQRAMIALALSCNPKLLLADEPTTALDATVQIQIILLLRELQQSLGMSSIFVTHDVGVAAEISDHVAVMYAGRIVESGTAGQILKSPIHPYTRGLLGSTVNGAVPGTRIDAIPGMPPDMARLPSGCAFAPRCNHRMDVCIYKIPELVELPNRRSVACVRVQDIL